VIECIAEAVSTLDDRPEAVGLAIPGQVDYYGMVWRLPNVPGFDAVPIAQKLMRRLDCHVVVENDATCAALGEHLWGRGRGFASYLLVTLGTGIGGGLVINDRLVRGAHGFTAEIGHIRINSSVDAWPCTCGQRGCVEAYAGTRGLLRKFAELGGHATRIREVAESARRGEPAGIHVFEHMGHWLGGLLVNVQNLLDLDAFVFTGGISQSFDLIEPALRATLRGQAFSPPLGQVPLLVSQLGPRAGLVGAAYLPMVREVAEREADSSPGDLLHPAVQPDGDTEDAE
jgi:glucokinase